MQSVEEGECRRAYDSATEVYTSSFDRTKPAEEVPFLMFFPWCLLVNTFIGCLIMTDILIILEGCSERDT